MIPESTAINHPTVTAFDTNGEPQIGRLFGKMVYVEGATQFTLKQETMWFARPRWTWINDGGQKWRETLPTPSEEPTDG